VHDDRHVIEDRIEQMLARRLRPAVYTETVPLRVESWDVPDEPVPVAEALAATYTPFVTGSRWGPAWSTTWFRVRGEIPAQWSGRRVEALIDLGFTHLEPGRQAEAMVYDAAGHPVKGLEPRTSHVPIAAPAAGGEDVLLYVEGAANPFLAAMTGTGDPRGDKLTADREPMYRLVRADLAVLNEDAWHLVLDTEVLWELMRELPPQDARRYDILLALQRMLDTLDLDDVAASAGRAREQLAGVLARPAHASAHRLSAVGHAHIDSAWMWPLRETVRKCGRTFANVLALTKDYPELVFACSQAQQYAWIKEHQPQIYAGIKAAVQSGNWQPVGGMWVESDVLLPGGESLARQLVHGTRFFREEFGVSGGGIWLPDSFGYTAALPQLARLAGAEWCLLLKLRWNESDRFPHNTFWWEGIDGSRIFTHHPPIDTYAATFAGAELAHAAATFKEKGAATTSLAMFGYGDGGGGPTREMMEKARRLRDLEGSPTVTVESATAFFDKARAEYPDPPVWCGELYVESHRGTYTTQATMKAGNRLAERLLREAELWSATAAAHGDFRYPYERLDRLWKTVLLHQFHDILPGTSIAWVHREARAAYAQVHDELEAIVAEATAALPGPGAILNAAPHDRAGVLTLPAGSAAGAIARHHLADGRALVWAQAPALGAGTAAAAPPDEIPAVTVDGLTLDNGLIRVTVDEDGLITSLYDHAHARETIPPGRRANLLQLHPDHPTAWDAWNLEEHYRHRHTDLTDAEAVEVVEKGPLLGAIRVRRSFGDSSVTQTLTLRAGSRRLDICTDVDWHEREKVLKAAFPFDLHALDESAEIQFGHLRRPIHTNTSWDAAKFEVYAHRWVHLDEAGYGVAVISGSTYGHDVSRTGRDGAATTTTLRLTLLRAPRNPDPETDQGTHRIVYAIVPGATVGDAVAEGYALTVPLRPADRAGDVAPLIRVENPAVVVESVKLADDRSGDIVVRLYESRGGQARTDIHCGVAVASAHLTDLLERPTAPVDVCGGTLSLRLRPFEICTLRLSPAPR
jgi:alpha-mannosidase